MKKLSFPSGLTIDRAKARATELVKTGQAKSKTEALDSISLREMEKPWALAMAQLQIKSNFTYYLIKQADIERVMEQEPLLTHFGFGHDDSYTESFYQKYAGCSKVEYLARFKSDRERLSNSLDECQRCCIYLKHLNRLKVFRHTFGSYGLKHSVEKYHRALKQFDDPYVANGALICAAIHMGFPIKRKDSLSPNVWISASLQSDIITWERLCEEQNSYWHFTQQKLFDKVSKSIGL